MIRSPEHILNMGYRLADVVYDQARWSQETFGPDSERGPKGALLHLTREATEAIEAIGTESFREEMADCLLLFLDATRRGGSCFEDIVVAAELKMKVNKAREWPKPTSDEPVEHVKPLQVYSFCDEDFYLAESCQHAIQLFIDDMNDWSTEMGCDLVDAGDMHRLKFLDDPGNPNTTSRTFAEEVEARKERGELCPGLFATNNY